MPIRRTPGIVATPSRNRRARVCSWASNASYPAADRRPPVAAPAHFGDVVDRRDRPGQRLVALRAGLPPVGVLVGRGAELVRLERREEVGPHRRHALVRTEVLVGRGRDEVGAEPVQVDRPVLGEVDAVERDERAGLPSRARPRSAAGGIVPTALDASVHATSLVRGPIACARSSRSTVTSSSRTSTQRTVAPASRAARTHGRTLASWSSFVTMISSPGPHVRAIERDRCRSSDVAFCPNTISPASQPSRSAPARRASAISASISSLTGNTPWVFEAPARIRACDRLDRRCRPSASRRARRPTRTVVRPGRGARARGTACGSA